LLDLLIGALAALAALGCARHLLRVRAVRRGADALTDDAIRAIETGGRIEVEDPLDPEEIREEEERFWQEERWDESEEW
jgi:hypothetical protein